MRLVSRVFGDHRKDDFPWGKVFPVHCDRGTSLQLGGKMEERDAYQVLRRAMPASRKANSKRSEDAR